MFHAKASTRQENRRSRETKAKKGTKNAETQTNQLSKIDGRLLMFLPFLWQELSKR